MSCSAGFYADGNVELFHCSPCRTAPGWAIALVVLGSLLVASIFLKLNSTVWFEYVVTPVRIGFIYVSVVSMLNLVRLQWPGGVANILSGMQLSLFKLDVFQGAACFLSFKTTFYVALYFPFALGLVFLGLLGLSAAITHERRYGWQQRLWAFIGIRADDHFRRRGRRRIRALLVRSFLSFLSSSYSYLAWASVQLFVCTDLGDSAGPRLLAFAEIVCYGPEWYTLFPSALLGLIVYVIGIPLLQLIILRRYAWGEHADAAAFLGYRVIGYKPGFRWWDTADIVWRLSVALSIQLLMQYPTAQLTFFAVLVSARLAAQRYCRPFVERLNNVHETLLQWLTLGILACGIIFYASKTKLSDAAQAFLFVLVVVCIAIIGLSVLRSTWIAFKGRRRFESERISSLSSADESSVSRSDVDRSAVALDSSSMIADGLESPLMREDH
jgi:hypothetical protein